MDIKGHKNLIIEGDLRFEDLPKWFQEAETENAVIEALDIKPAGPGSLKTTIRIQWIKGIWKSGTWGNGTWKSGTWEGGIWKDGTWEGGTWKDGIWKDGTWKGGTWKDGIWKDGTWENGTWKEGYWHDGTWENGTWRYGTWRGGTWKNGAWKYGFWKSGTWENGTWEGGEWFHGKWEGGTWKDGIWEDGTWKSWEKPGVIWLRVNNLAKHRMMVELQPTESPQIAIGCSTKTIKEWDEWFAGEEEFETPRDTIDFNRIQAAYGIIKAMVEPYQKYFNIKE